MNSQEIAYSKGKNDECFTLDYAVAPILKYIPANVVVWCPFDNKDSEFVKQISKTNKVVFSNISEGKDFFEYEPDNWDMIVSNPPFSNKRKYFERAIDLGKPFALIMTNTWLNDSAPKQIFKDIGLQLLMFDKRMLFRNGGVVNNKITFSSSYFCRNFLPQQLIIENLIRE